MVLHSNTIRRTVQAHDVVSYVTSFVVFDHFYGFVIGFTTIFSLMSSVTGLVSSKRAHLYTRLFSFLYLNKIKKREESSAHDVVSYVTSFVVFDLILHDFTQILVLIVTLFCKATDYISTKRAHYLLLLFALCWGYRNTTQIVGARDVVSYVTSFVVFWHLLHILP